MVTTGRASVVVGGELVGDGVVAVVTLGLEYKYPVGFPGLQISMAFVFGVINFSKSAIGGNANPVSIVEIKGTTVTPDAVEKPL